MGEYFSTNNKFGIWYVITRLALAILIILQLVLLIIGVISYNHSVGGILWAVFCCLVLLIGLLAAWREHFLTALIFAIIEVILAVTGFVYGAAAYTAAAVVLCIVCSIIFAIMLWMSGSRDLGPPQVC